MFKLGKWLVGTLGALTLCGAASAASLGGSMGVSATVVPGCTGLKTSALSFGTVPTGNATRDATATITVTCSEGVAYDVTIDNGLCHPFLATQRKLGLAGSCSNTLDYEIYLDAGHTRRWHDGGFLSGTEKLQATGSGIAQDHTAFGRATSNSGTVPGAYTDTLSVTLSF